MDIFFKLLKNSCLLDALLIVLFWTVGEVCPGSQVRMGLFARVFHRLCTMDSPDSQMNITPTKLLGASMAVDPFPLYFPNFAILVSKAFRSNDYFLVEKYVQCVHLRPAFSLFSRQNFL